MSGYNTCSHGVCFDCGYHGFEHHEYCDSGEDYPKADEAPCGACAREKAEAQPKKRKKSLAVHAR